MTTIENFEKRYNSALTFGFYLVLIIGIGFRICQYFMGRSLWEDEAHLALNFISRGYLDLLKPLDYLQAAPPLFLWSVKTFALIFGYGPRGLRALPFLTSILTLPLFYHILKAICKSRIVALVGFFAFAVNLSVIYFSSELKTYGLDVAVYILMIYLALSQHSVVVKNRNNFLAVSGCLSLLYSNVAFIILFCVGCYFALGWLRNRKINLNEVRVIIFWAIVLIAYYFLFVFHHPYEQAQRQNYSFGFPPHPIFSSAFNQFIAGRMSEISFYLLYISKDFGFICAFAILLLLGIVGAVYGRRYEVLLFSLIPILVHFTLSLLQIYPFWYRLILYFVPALLLLSAYGLDVLANILTLRLKAIAGIAVAVYCTIFLSKESLAQFPLWSREINPILSYINQDYPNEPLFITTPYTLYKYSFLTGSAKNPQYEGLQWNINPEKYYASVAGANGNYVLLHAEDNTVDGYKDVIDDLKKRGLIVREFYYKSYVVSEIKPLRVDTGAIIINRLQFKPMNTADINGEQVVAIWTGTIQSDPIFLSKGHYKYTVTAKGTPLGGIYPHLNIMIDSSKGLSFSTSGEYQQFEGEFNLNRDKNIMIRVNMDNDASNLQTKEDRNAFIHLIRFRKINKP